MKVIAILGALAAVAGPVVTWLVMRKQFSSKQLAYTFEIEPLLKSADPDLARDLKITFRGEELPRPAQLGIEISNTGYTAIEDAAVVVKLPGSTYLIPGYFVDVPAGYDDLWDIERTDAEECTIRFRHINPGQVAKVRLLMDELPSGAPSISCPMPNVRWVQAKSASFGEAVVMASKIAAFGIQPALGGSLQAVCWRCLSRAP